MLHRASKYILIFLTTFILVCSISCNNDKEEVPKFPEMGTMTDIDEHVYKTVKIGNQWWMAENLEVKRYRNGDNITLAQNLFDWENKKAAYCYFEDKKTAPGVLYNAYAVLDSRNIAPAGWHIATDEDWMTMEKHLGMNAPDAEKTGWRGTNEGDKIKMKGPIGWTKYEKVWGTNQSGFSALAGSCRLHDGRFGDPGLNATGFWWTTSGYSSTEIWYRYLDYKNSNIFRSHTDKNYGFSVRCVKD